MTAQLTVNRSCTRCPRVEQTEVSIDEIVKLAQQSKGGPGKAAIPEGPKALSIRIDEKPPIEFGFLCNQCRQIVMRYIEHIVHKPEKQSALRTQTKVEVEDVEA